MTDGLDQFLTVPGYFGSGPLKHPKWVVSAQSRLVSALSRFDPGSFQSESFRHESFHRWVVSTIFGGSFWPYFFQPRETVTGVLLVTLTTFSSLYLLLLKLGFPAKIYL